MSPTIKTLLVSGLSTLLALIVTSIYNWIKDARHKGIKNIAKRIEEVDNKIDDLRTSIDNLDCHVKANTDKALQALLRNKLYEIYDLWMPKKYAPTDIKENFENLYQRYHTLGKNGVMDGKHEAFMNLPDTKYTKEVKK